MKIFKNGLTVLTLLFIGTVAKAQIEVDWTEIQKVLTDCTGQYTGVNNNVATSGLPDGPLLGNGTVGVVGSCDVTWGRFYITTTDFWTGAHLNAVPLPIGGVNIIVGGSPGTGVEKRQEFRCTDGRLQKQRREVLWHGCEWILVELNRSVSGCYVESGFKSQKQCGFPELFKTVGRPVSQVFTGLKEKIRRKGLVKHESIDYKGITLRK